MKTTALAALALVATATMPARAETIARERFGCHTQEVIERLFQMVAANEEEAFGQLLNSSLANGECKVWKLGEDVRIENRTTGLGCLTAAGSSEPCYWTPLGAIQKPE